MPTTIETAENHGIRSLSELVDDWKKTHAALTTSRPTYSDASAACQLSSEVLLRFDREAWQIGSNDAELRELGKELAEQFVEAADRIAQISDDGLSPEEAQLKGLYELNIRDRAKTIRRRATLSRTEWQVSVEAELRAEFAQG